MRSTAKPQARLATVVAVAVLAAAAMAVSAQPSSETLVTSAAVALQGDEAMDESCVQQGVCVLCDYEKMMQVPECETTHYVEVYLCNDDGSVSNGAAAAAAAKEGAATTSPKQLYRPCRPPTDDMSRHNFIIFELCMTVGMLSTCFLTLRRQQQHQQQHSERIAKRIGLV